MTVEPTMHHIYVFASKGMHVAVQVQSQIGGFQSMACAFQCTDLHYRSGRGDDAGRRSVPRHLFCLLYGHKV